jgi:hypothetical protein
MAKPNSIPVAKRRSNKKMPVIPTIISFIFTSPDPYDIEYEHAALKQTADGDAIGDRIERYLDCGCNFP